MTNRTATDLDKVIGRRLTAARLARGLTQSVLARTIGVTFQQVQKYESGANRIAVSTLSRLCDALDLNPADFFPRLMKDGRAAPDPLAALGSTIVGCELAVVCSGLDRDAQTSVLNVAKAIAGAKAVVAAAQAA